MQQKTIYYFKRKYTLNTNEMYICHQRALSKRRYECKNRSTFVVIIVVPLKYNILVHGSTQGGFRR